MFKKCQSGCHADKYLWIRGNVFYFMMELTPQNGQTTKTATDKEKSVAELVFDAKPGCK